MPFENGEQWRPLSPDARGRYASFSLALDAALKSLVTTQNPFFDEISDKWQSLFPSLPMRPGRFENGTIYLYVKSAPLFFAMRPKLAAVKKQLLSLSNAPKKITLRLEIHS